MHGRDMPDGELHAHRASIAAEFGTAATTSSRSPVTTVIEPRLAQSRRPPSAKTAAEWKRQLANVRPRLKIVD
jgi:hypothetical protein